MVKDGHWRADNADSERGAWEESVRLRDQMFWSRIGGGVVPARDTHLHPAEKVTRNSNEATRPSREADIVKASSGVSRVSSSSGATLRSDELLRRKKTPIPELTTSTPRPNVETVISHEGDRSQLEASITEPNSHLGDTMADQIKDRGQSQRLSLTIPNPPGDEPKA